MKRIFIYSSIVILSLIALLSVYSLWWLLLLVPVIPLVILGIVDMVQTSHTILRNFPVIGHIRYAMEFIAPELHQYFVESDVDGRPFSRLQRNYVYKHAKQQLQTHPFGTEQNVYKPGYYWLAHSMYPKQELSEIPRVKFGGAKCLQPYSASIFNISAMSFGALGMNAILALNEGAKKGNFYHNTGEGGISPYHLKHGGDLVWQLGTAYFGCRDEEGNFSETYFKEGATLPSVKMIEIKISQGAKPGLGGLLPASKNTKEIARIRKLAPHKLIHSPPAHQTFSTAEGLLKFVDRLRQLSGGKPVGFKLCVGSRSEFVAICEAMVKTGEYPDFITVDGGEGGTGAAPMEFSDNVGMPLEDALVFVCDTLEGYDLKKHIRIIASCKVITGFDLVKYIAIGADACNSARGMMFALGCVQALQCNTNECPVGVATQDHALQKGLVPRDKATRVTNYHNETVKSAMSMLTAAGIDNFESINRSYIYKRIDHHTAYSLEKIYPYTETGSLLNKKHDHGESRRKNKEGHGQLNKTMDPQRKNNDYPSSSEYEEKKARNKGH
jgi:glutamate synthase domain-containing protein 2